MKAQRTTTTTINQSRHKGEINELETVKDSVNMELWRKLLRAAVLVVLVAATIDLVSAEEEGTTEVPDLTMATTIEPG